MDHLFRLYMIAIGYTDTRSWEDVLQLRERIMEAWRANGRPRIVASAAAPRGHKNVFFFFYRDENGEDRFESELQAVEASDWTEPAPIEEVA